MKLDKIEQKSLTHPQIVEQWLDDTRVFNHNALALRSLQEWGISQCGWPSLETPSR
jgi:hypothetical protein